MDVKKFSDNVWSCQIFFLILQISSKNTKIDVLENYSTIIWDLDGTLMDTLKDLWLSTNHALKVYGMPERTYEEVRQFVGNGVRKLIERATPDGDNNPLFEDVFNEFKRYYMLHCQDNTQPYEGIIETLHKLKEQGKRMAIVSNKLQSGVTELHKQWFSDVIEVAVGERDGIKRKPAPDMVEVALNELGVDKQNAVYIGDSDVDIATARNSNLPCISVLWGFRDRDFLTYNGATTFAEKPENLLS